MLGQGGNVVEWIDPITAPPFGVKGKGAGGVRRAA